MGFNNQKGAAAVEFAIVLTLLVLILLGTIEFGLLLCNKQIVTNASREGARAAIATTLVDGAFPSVEVDRFRNIIGVYCNNNLINLGGGNDLDTNMIDISSPDGQNDVTVTVPYVYNFLFAGILGFDNLTLTGTTVMRMME